MSNVVSKTFKLQKVIASPLGANMKAVYHGRVSQQFLVADHSIFTFSPEGFTSSKL